MAAFRTGDTITWLIGPFTDVSGNPVTGGTQAVIKAIRPGGTFSPTLSEISDGLYQATVVSTVRGLWALYSSVTATNGAVYRDFDKYTVDDELAYTASGSAGSVGAALANLDAAVSTRLATGSYIAPAGNVVLTTAPIALNGTITLYQRNDYKAAETRSLDWTTSDAATWPDLTGSSIAFASQPIGGVDAWGIAVAGTVVTPTGTTKHVRVEVPASATQTTRRGAQTYQVRATLSNGDVITLASGALNVVDYIEGP